VELVLISGNTRYMERLERYVRTSAWRDHIRIHRFTSVDQYRASDLALAENSKRVILAETVDQSAPIEGAWRLTSDRRQETDDRSVFMFQPASQIIEMMLRHASGQEAAPAGTPSFSAKGERESAKVVCVVSPFGGAGVTTIACALSRLMALRRGKVLYVQLSLYPEPFIAPEDAQYDLSRLIYMLTARPAEAEQNWRQYCGIHPPTGVYSIRLPAMRRDLRDVTAEHVAGLCELFRRIGFATIVFDLAAHWLDDLIEGRIPYDECWLVCPWKKRRLAKFPQVREFAGKRDVKFIVTSGRPFGYEDHMTEFRLADEALEIDAIVPWVPDSADSEDSLVTDERIDAIVSRLVRESIALKGGDAVG